MSSSIKRITKELGDWYNNPIEGIRNETATELFEKKGDEEINLYKWNVYVDGPPESVYAGGTFHVVVTLPANYPFKVPQVNFRTRIWHPNITNDDEGSICLEALKPDNWKPAVTVRKVFERVVDLLAQPNPDDPLEARIADEYRQSPAEFAKNAKAYVDRHAKKK